MRARLALSIGIATLIAAMAPRAAAQQAQPSALARALLARYPEHEIVPQSCRGAGPLVSGDRLCLMDARTGLVRAVRRVALGGDIRAAMRGRDVVFAVGDFGGASTRFRNRVWRWDLTRDAYLGIGNIEEGFNQVFETSFGIVYRLRSGLFVSDGGQGRRVGGAELPSRVQVVGDATFAIEEEPAPIRIRTVELAGDQLRLRDHATMPGRLLYAERGVVVSATTRGRAVRVHLLRLPATEVIEIALPEGLRLPRSASAIDATHVRLSGPRRQSATLDVAAATITADAAPPPADAAPAVLAASSLVHVVPTAGGVYVGRFDGGWLLDATGATSQQRPPRAARARCSCTETTLVCERAGVTVQDACTDVPELDRISDEYASTATGQQARATLYTDDGRFRIDRLEADHVRVTRLRDGARLWIRLFGGALFAQTDDGGYFASDRALVDRMAIRDGRSLLDAPVAPLAPRADALFRPDLVRAHFAP